MEKKKSPSINFYSSDFLTGTTFFSNKECGGYLRLLLYQHQLGHLNENVINQVLFDFNEEEKQKVLEKFSVDSKGKYFNKRMEEEINKKKKYSESRANNRKSKGNISKTYDEDMKNICERQEEDNDKPYEKHMENEIEVVVVNNNNINNNILNGIKNIIEFIEKNFNRSISSYELEQITNLVKTYGKDITYYAFQKTLDADKKSLNYTKGILKNWKDDNLTTLEEIKEKEENIRTSKKNKKQSMEEAFEQLAREGRI